MKPPILLSALPGCFDHEHATWLVGPVGRSRDSDLIEESNFDVVTARMREIDPEEHDHEIHRFGHWAVGWIEEIAYRPDSECARYADSVRESLDGYAILDEMHHSMLESEAVSESWESWQAREVRARILTELVSRIQDPDTDADPDELEAWLDGMSDDRLWEVVHDLGETCDGALRLSDRDIERAATALVAADE